MESGLLLPSDREELMVDIAMLPRYSAKQKKELVAHAVWHSVKH